jgi:hypothetical protein
MEEFNDAPSSYCDKYGKKIICSRLTLSFLVGCIIGFGLCILLVATNVISFTKGYHSMTTIEIFNASNHQPTTTTTTTITTTTVTTIRTTAIQQSSPVSDRVTQLNISMNFTFLSETFYMSS